MDTTEPEENGIRGRVRTFDAFRKYHVSKLVSYLIIAFKLIHFAAKVAPTYTTQSSQGGLVTILLSLFCVYLIWGELGSYFAGIEEQQFVVDNRVGWDMQINFDITVAMPCITLHVNVQDAAGDRLLAAELVEMEPTDFDLSKTHELTVESRSEAQEDDDLQSVFRRAKAAKKFSKTKKMHHPNSPACRLYGSMKVNKVQGDFHITGKNFAYADYDRSMLTRDGLNFSHVIDEFSFGEYYPKLENPLDGVAAIIDTSMSVFFLYISNNVQI